MGERLVMAEVAKVGSRSINLGHWAKGSKVSARKRWQRNRASKPGISIKQLVYKFLERCQGEGKIYELTFEEVDKEVKRFYPKAMFNKSHLSWYKHHFLRRL